MDKGSLKWSQFENYVASLYASLDYAVTRDLVIGGQQIDVLIEKHMQGIGSIKSMVECKFRSSKSVSNQEVFDTISAFQVLRHDQQIDRCIIISNRPFSHQSQQAAERDHRVHLLTIEQLEDSLFRAYPVDADTHYM